MEIEANEFDVVVAARRGLPLEALRRLPALLSAQDAFDVMGISRSTGYELVREGLVPSVDLGGRRWVRTVELAERVFGIRPEDLLGSRDEVAE